MFQYSAQVIRIVDGDTLWLDIDLGFYTHRQVDIRLANINTPERVQYTAQGIQDPARAYVEECLAIGSECVVDITTRDKYGRWLGVIRFLPGVTKREEIAKFGRVLNDELLARGFALPYQK
jgi:micrococcal nuclease